MERVFSKKVLFFIDFAFQLIIVLRQRKLTPLSLKNVKTWQWGTSTLILSVALGDVVGDGKVEIATGGDYNDGSHEVALLSVWG